MPLRKAVPAVGRARMGKLEPAAAIRPGREVRANGSGPGNTVRVPAQGQAAGSAGPAQFPVALSLAFPRQGSILFETSDSGHDEMIGALNNIILRLLSVAPAGRLNFTILDPVGLGQNFAGIMHLADYEERLINSRIWTQTGKSRTSS